MANRSLIFALINPLGPNYANSSIKLVLCSKRQYLFNIIRFLYRVSAIEELVCGFSAGREKY